VTPSDTVLSKPTFLVGSVRSGTTLLRLMLDHHPLIAWHFDFEYAVDRIGEDGRLPPTREYHDYLATHRGFQLSGAKIDTDLDYAQLVNSFLIQKRDRDGKTLVGATVHRHIDRLLHLWPDARFIHLLRDGRDVGRSIMQMGWAGNMWRAPERWIRAERDWETLWDRLSENRRLEVRYEHLVADPRNTLVIICRFIGVDFDDAMFDYAKTSTYDAPDPSLATQWRRKLDKNAVCLAEARIGDMLVERGYELSGLPPKKIGKFELQRLNVQDWWYRARFRMKRYGLPLFLTDYIVRHLKLKALARRLTLRINEIENRHIR